MKEKIKRILSQKSQKQLRKIIKNISSSFALGDLNKLAKIHGTDKWGSHWYTQHYHNHFRKFRSRKINILEIGVGGYEEPLQGGNSLRTWKSYFKKAMIFGLDLYDKTQLQEKRIKIFQGSQVDKEFLLKVVNEIGVIDIIIDDGSHVNEHVIETFKILFPLLKQGGLYVVEDLETSYSPEYGGSSLDLNCPDTSMNFFKGLTDSLNYSEYILPGYLPSYFDLNITGMHFYHNMVFIDKNDNNEKSVNIIDNKYHRLEQPDK